MARFASRTRASHASSRARRGLRQRVSPSAVRVTPRRCNSHRTSAAAFTTTPRRHPRIPFPSRVLTSVAREQGTIFAKNREQGYPQCLCGFRPCFQFLVPLFLVYVGNKKTRNGSGRDHLACQYPPERSCLPRRAVG